MLDLTIYSYGYSEIIYHTLQGIAMFRNSTFYTTVISTVALFTGLVYALQIAGAESNDQLKQSIRKVLGMIIFIHVLLLPVTTMTVKDNVEKHYWRVDNIPLAFALPIGIIENFGHILTAGFEQVFSLVDSSSAHNYYHYGSVFGARLQKEVLRAKVRDPEFISNMSNFIERCVILPSMIGKQFTKEELVASEDMWGLIAKRAGTFTRTPMIKNGVRVSPHPKCRDAVPYFEKKFNEAIGLNITSWSWKFKGAGEGKKYNLGTRALNNNIKAQIKTLYGNNSSVDALLKHNMMINAINSYRSGKYSAAKAQLHNEAGGLISGDLAEKTLTGSLAVMKVIIYGAFIFLFPLLIVSGGISKYRSWITAAFSLALWPSLFSMLNMIIDFAYQPSTIVSYSSWSTELKKFDAIASTAANLKLMIPFLSFWITRMGEGGFIHLAGSIMSTANSASAIMAGEKASGSRSWDNESIRNYNSDNVSSNKHDSSMQYVSGSARSMMSDGSTEMITSGGKALYFGGAGQSASTGESNYRMGSGWAMSNDEAVRYETQNMHSETAARTIAQEKLHAEEASAMYSIMQHTKTDNGYNIDTSTEQGREIHEHLQAIDKLNSSNDYSWEQNAKAYASTEASGGLKFLGIGVSVSAGGEVSASNSSSQSDSISNEVSTDIGTGERSSNTERVGKQSAYLESIGVDKNSQDSMRESYQEVERLDKSIAEHKNKIDSHNETINYAKNHSGEMSKDMYQETVDYYQKLYGGSARAANEAVSTGTDKAKAAFKDLTSKQYQDKFNEIHNRGNLIRNSDNVNKFIEANQIDPTIGIKRDQFARDNNIETDKDKITNELHVTGEKIKNEHDTKYQQNEDEFELNKQTITNTQEAKQGQIDEHEKNRIGRGKISRAIGGASNVVTLGSAGWGLGRPEPEEVTQFNPEGLDLGDPIAKPYKPPSDDIFNSREIQSIMDSFNLDKNPDIDQPKKGTQYVDPKNK